MVSFFFLLYLSKWILIFVLPLSPNSNSQTMEENEKEDRIEKKVKKSPLQKTFDKILWFACVFASIGVVGAIIDFAKGRELDWMATLGYITAGLVFILVYAIISLVVERSKRYAQLNDKEKDEKKGQLCFLVLFVLFASVFIVCGILS